ncbi:2,3-bisphosphoglycerate-independent phosphoglycerate mutase [Arcobacter sp. FWKO B]|uniref:2,3-bisphosphoglycerate-independent phosphoglycerate mutase n=1 Tax=Arcobacter sp. FWKO B TaxID=2593672 RepID=UPI0018A5D5AC|nr:2,3-bisphosphoglycerate-independent phosphoglycerate mutase [Arcobacter sp. FWKO B]QOG13236.1 2,3-bisphosphoglycerate-independent phosphoglycerate mutase [Arcobacter sp. FWKO B]
MQNTTKKVILIITDGIGYNPKSEYNAFLNAKKPTYDYLFENVPNSLIKTYGLSVGLPEGQMGNSEVGHMCLGSGRILYQDLVKVNLAVENNTLKDNEILKNILSKSNNIHLIGLASDGGVHSHIDHIIEFAKIAQQSGKKVFLHPITDGRDVSPTSSHKYIKQLLSICSENIKLATISGRFYTMDRDNRWDRVQKGYDVIANAKNKTNLTPLEYVDSQYSKEIYDEFLEPASFDGYNGIEENDGLIFCNFRSDRAREISNAFANSEFNHFETKKVVLNIATLTQYDKNLPLPVLFPKDNVTNTLAQTISDAKLSQFHTAETEKYAHVTFFFNGGKEEPFTGEDRVLIPSPKVATYDLKPQMSAPEVGNAVLEAINKGYDFIVVNFANGDMVGHTGVYEAGIKAVEAVDEQIGKILNLGKEKGYSFVITSDHGNCEMMRDDNGETLTNHTVGDVYCFVVDENVKEIKNGGLNNIAPTVLKLMNLEIPKEMDEPLC